MSSFSTLYRPGEQVKILIIGINYAPEPAGIAVYTSGMAQELACRGHKVTVICAPPHFPQWKVFRGFSSRRYVAETEAGVRVIRCPVYVPRNLNGITRLLHYLSFATSSFLPALLEASRRPDVVLSVAPSIVGAPVALLAARAARADCWLHIQDFEVEAAFATEVLAEGGIIGRMALLYERWVLKRFRHVSAISPRMCQRLVYKGVPQDRVVEFRNWADVLNVRPTSTESSYRAQWRITTRDVALYSGSIGNKQGIELLLEAAKLLVDQDITFVICGDGPSRSRIEARAKELANVQFHGLQPRERLNELLNLATVHVLPQIAEAADLVLPSKLGNMLASGRPVIVTAVPGSGLFDEVKGCGIATTPGDAEPLARAITEIIHNPEAQARLGQAARSQAEDRLDIRRIIDVFERYISAVAQECQRSKSTSVKREQEKNMELRSEDRE